MSVYKKINPSYINLNQYEVNKQYDIPLNNISNNGINIYLGEYLPINNINFFDILNDDKTTNNEYKRLIFSSIKHLYYNNYFFNNYISSSLYEQYDQNTLFSGSFTTTIRQIGNISGSSFQGINSIYNDNVIYNDTYLYDNVLFDNNKGSLITLLSINKNICGNNISPKSFSIIFDNYYIKDDGEGNLFDYGNEEEYLNKINTNTPGEIYIGNIIYSHGLIIITNEGYICILGSPPIAVNDYYSYYNIEQPLNFDITSNDYSDCGGINYNSLELLNNSSSLNYFINDENKLQIINNQASFIPGNYWIEYNISNNNGFQSNIGLVNINILEYPLEITNFTSSLICPGSTGSISYSFKINGGTPAYKYSWDNNNYTNINGFYNIIITGSINSDNNTLYIKDYQNKIISQSFNFFFDEIDYNIISNGVPLCALVSDLIISSSNGLTYTLNSSPIIYNTNQIYNLSAGNYTASIKDINECIQTAFFTISNQPLITYDFIKKDVSCFGFNDGHLEINNIQGGSNILYNVIINSSSFEYPTDDIFIENITSNIYNISIEDSITGCITTSSIEIKQPDQIIIDLSKSYENSCYSNLLINVTGGIRPYNYEISTPLYNYITSDLILDPLNNIYNNDINQLNLTNESLSNFIANIKITDNNNCITTSSITIDGREFVYSGSYCETSGSGSNTGFIINPRVIQIFNSGFNENEEVDINFRIDFDPNNNFTSSLICNTVLYEYKTFNPIQCEPSENLCLSPLLISCDNINCFSNEFNYDIIFNSNYINPSGSIYKIEYSTDINFSNTGSQTIITSNTSSIINNNINISNLSPLPINDSNDIYFRIKNICSGSESLYSNIKSGKCTEIAVGFMILLERRRSIRDACGCLTPLSDILCEVNELGEIEFLGFPFYINDILFVNATNLYSNSEGALALRGWYYDGIISRYWNGNSFINTIYCEL